jgi:tetratricopeptide (TPR) repeat protein
VPEAAAVAPVAPTPAAQPTDELAAALEAEARGDLPAACALYEAYLAKHPTSTRALNNYALVCAKMGNRAKAETLLDEAIALDPHFAEAHVNLGNLHLAAGADRLAEEDYRRALGAHAGDVAASENLARLFERQGKLAEAEGVLAECVKPGAPGEHDAESLALYGRVLLRESRLDAAKPALERALTEDPSLFRAQTDLGVVRLERGEPEAAIACFDLAIARNASYAPAYNDRANARVAEGHLDDAKVDYEKALEIDPASAEAHFNYALLAERFGNFLFAIEEYGRVLEIDQANVRAMNNLGLLYRRGKKPEEALKYFDRAITRAPDMAEAHYNRGLALLDLGRVGEASTAFERYAALEPAGSPHRKAVEETLEKVKAAAKAPR